MVDEHLDHEIFSSRFHKAVECDIAFARSMVRQSLPDSWRFLIEPNASYDENPLVDDETLYLKDSLPAGDMLGPLSFEEALSWLWRDGKVPEWIDVSVCAADLAHTYVRLICCGRFTGLEKRLYYRDGLPPFGIKSPNLPPGWESVQANGRFDLPTIVRGYAEGKFS